ncbi:MAG: hypothetical protein COA45_11105 [Zetaproteobacteria bacterium]|nr:MAG: hypothetical protein COA45_11105 [Zetaproteobacteria bacterium]
MTLKYSGTEHWAKLFPILEDHTAWYHVLVQCLFYPESMDLMHRLKKPTSFAQWVVYANREKDIQPEIVEKLSAVHADMFKIVDVLTYNVKETKAKPSHKEFEKFLTHYEEFLFYVRRLEKDLHQEGSGYDSQTGLRSKKMLYEDIQRELERLERQGKSFCIAFMKLDNFDLIRHDSPHDERSGYIRLISGLIKLSIRSFDDAYYMGEDEFVLSLKQTDVSGAVSALERLRRELEMQKVMLQLEDGGKEIPLSMSCCIAEPVGGDDVHDLLKNLRADLKNTKDKKADTVLEYHELSPLQRYVQGDA